MMDKILNNDEKADELLDVNQNGVATVEDLFLLNRAGDIVGGIPTIPVGESYSINEAQIQVEHMEDKLEVEVIDTEKGCRLFRIKRGVISVYMKKNNTKHKEIFKNIYRVCIRE